MDPGSFLGENQTGLQTLVPVRRDKLQDADGAVPLLQEPLLLRVHEVHCQAHGTDQGVGPSPLPLVPVLAVSFMYVCSALAETILLPFAPLMVAGFHVTEDPRALGYYAGLLASSFYLGMLLTSALWGYLSDRVGRRPILALSLLTTSLSALFFGFSPSLPSAMAARFINGLLSGAYPVGRTTMSELCSSANQARGFSILSLNWGIGLLLGPCLGGFLAQPCDKYPSFFPPHSSLFSSFPFALPCILVSLLSLLACAFLVFFLPETLGRAHYSDLSSATEGDTAAAGGGGGGAAAATGEIGDGGEAGGWVDDDEGKSGRVVANSSCRNRETGPEGTTRTGSPLLSNGVLQPEVEHPSSFVEALMEKDTVLAAMLFSVLCFGLSAVNEVFSLWAITEWRFGGLAFGTSSIGLIQATGGLAMIPFQLFLFPPLVDHLLPLTTLKLGILAMAPVALFPLVRWIRDYRTRMVACALMMVLRSVSSTTAFTTMVMVITNSVRHPQHLGAVNGFSTMATLALEVAAPATGASIFAWSISSGHTFPFDYHLFWLFWLALCALMFSIASCLPDSVNARKFEVS